MRFRLVWLAVAVVLAAAGSCVAQDTGADEMSARAAAESIDVSPDDLVWHVLSLSAEDLSDVAETWQRHLAKNLQAISGVATLREPVSPAKRTDASSLSQLLTENDDILDRYDIVLSAWERKGGDDAAIDRHWDFMRGSTAQLVRSADLATFVTAILHWALSWRGGISVVAQIGILLAGFLLFLALARVLRRTVDRRIAKQGTISALRRTVARNVVFWLILMIGGVFLLVRNGASLTAVAAVIGGLGFMLAVAMQNALGNIASGILIAIFRPFDLGDIVRVGDVVGQVEDLTPAATCLRGPDNLPIRIPNEDVWKARISNYSEPDALRVELVFNIGFPQDQDRAVDVLRGVMQSEPLCHAAPEPEVFVAEVGEASISIYCRGWVDAGDLWVARWALNAAGVAALHKAGLQIATPYYDVRLHQDQANPG